MKLIEHVYAIRGLLSKGIASDDTQYSLRFIAHFLNVARALLTEQKADKYNYISEQGFQSLCVPLELGSFHNCCDYPNATCKVLKSVNTLPKFLNARWGDFAKVMSLNGEVISKGSPTAAAYSKYTITNKEAKPSWFIHDNHLFILSNTSLEIVLLNCLFNNPIEIEQLNCATSDTECPDFFDTEYPIDPDLVDACYKKVLDLMAYSMRLPYKDAENDAKDSQVSVELR